MANFYRIEPKEAAIKLKSTIDSLQNHIHLHKSSDPAFFCRMLFQIPANIDETSTYTPLDGQKGYFPSIEEIMNEFKKLQ